MKQPLDRLRSMKKPVTRRIPIPLDSEIADEFNRAKGEAHMLRSRADELSANTPAWREANAKAVEAEARVEELTDEIRDKIAWFSCRSMGPNAFEDLVGRHLPTKEQRENAKKDGNTLGWNPDSFPPALLVACVSWVDYDPESGDEVLVPLTEEFVKEMLDNDDGQWNQAEVMGLFAQAYEVNTNRRVVDMGNGSRQTRS